MRLASCHYQGQERIAVMTDRGIAPLSPGDGWPISMLALIDAGTPAWSRLAHAIPQLEAQALPLSAVTLTAPIPRPRKNIMCLGWNYAEHAQESAATRGQEANLPEHPVVFTKSVTSVNAPNGDIPAQPAVTGQLDWEVELGVVIGIGGHGIGEHDALRHVFGYTVINDISARDVQFRHKQYFLGKSLEGACPMGPVIITADELENPQTLDLRCWVNGDLKQSSNTRHQIFSVAATIAILSRGMRLEPGDIIATGTPSGVGFVRNPPEFLKSGDVVECEVEHIGRLRNRVI